jgi:ribosomal subunit interface protein
MGGSMQTPAEILFVNMDRSAAVESVIRGRIERLEQFYDRITSCHVMIQNPHPRHRKGNLYEVKIEVRVPGSELAVNNKPGDVHAHENILIAVRDAFNAMERQVKRFKRQLREAPRGRNTPLQGKITEINLGEGFGLIATTDGRLVYFHENSVINRGFVELKPGDPVELVVQEDESEKGPQASTVRPIRPMTFVEKPR